MTFQVGSGDHTMQKKAYRLLEELCRSDRQNCADFVRRKVALPRDDASGLRGVFLSSLSSASPSSMAPRLKCLVSIVHRLAKEADDNEEGQKFVRDVLPEAVLCLRAVNKKARETAVELIRAAGEAMVEWGRIKQRGEDIGEEDEEKEQEEGEDKTRFAQSDSR